MKANSFYFILLFFIVLLVYLSILQQGIFREAQRLNQSLEVHLDTLSSITTKYRRIHQNYQYLHTELLSAKQQVNDIGQKLTQQSLDQQQHLRQIQDSLQLLIATYDTTSTHSTVLFHPQKQVP